MARKNTETKLTQAAMQSAHEIWLAGLGAFGTARHEGNKLFHLLVKEGKGLEARTRAFAGGGVKELRSRAGGAIGQLEREFEARLAKALKGMGIPTARDVEQLSRHVAQLDRHVAALVARRGAAKGSARSARR